MGSTHSLTSAMSTLEWRVGCVACGVYAIGCADAARALANPELAMNAHLPKRSRNHASQNSRSHLIIRIHRRGFGYTRAYETESRSYHTQCLWPYVVSRLLQYHCRWLVALSTPIGMRLIRAIAALATPCSSAMNEQEICYPYMSCEI
jgi:hypothetical protein